MWRLSVAKLRRIKTHLRSGGVIAYATESCFGLGCDPQNSRAVRKLLRIKRRPKHKGLIVIGDRKERFTGLIRPISAQDLARVAATWPGPHTWLIPVAENVKKLLTGYSSVLAVRVTAHRDARNLCARLKTALVSTSANRAGERPLKTTRDCLRRFGQNVMVIGGHIGQRKNPSAIQDLRTGRIFR